VAQKPYELDITLNGRLSPSVLKAIADTEAMLKRLNVSSKTFNAAMNVTYREAFSGAEKAVRQTNKLADAMMRIGEIGAGVGIGEMLVKGLEAGVGMVEKMAEGIKEMAFHASDLAGKFEMQSRGIGNLLRNQPAANMLMNQLQTVANLSPFQLSELADTARSLTARGVPADQLLGKVTQLGNITAGVGGSAPELERITLAYGEALSGKTLTTREVNQLTQAGVPVWEELIKITGKSVAELHKLIEKHGLDATVLDKVFYNLTTGMGVFTDAMENFSKTHVGLVTTWKDKTNQALRDFGFIINDWVDALLRFANTSGVWDEAHRWLTGLEEMSKSVLTFVSGLNQSFPVFDRLRTMFDGFNSWIGSFFNLVEIPNQGNVMVLNATGNEQVKLIVDNATKMFNSIADFVTSPAVKNLAKWAGGALVDEFTSMFHELEAIINIFDDISQGKFKEAWSEFHKWKDYAFGKEARVHELWTPPDTSSHTTDALSSHWNRLQGIYDTPAWQKSLLGIPIELKPQLDDNTRALQDLTNTLGGSVTSGGGGSYGANYGLHGSMSDVPGTTYYEHPDTEGHSSQYGPAGNKLGYGYGVGIGKSYGNHFGEWAKIRLPDGRVLYRQVNERSSRDHGIEFVTPHDDESSYGTGKSEILGFSKDKPTTMNIHIHAIDSDSFASTVHKHAEVIASHVHRVLQSDYERSMVV
jgi:tape measure domain-containing protein